MSLHALVEKWRSESSRRFDTGDLTLGYVAAVQEKCADELAAALAGGGEAVAWVVVDTTMPLNKDDGSAFLGNYWVRFETNSADRANRAVRSFANGNPDGRYKLVPLFTHPAGAVPVTDDLHTRFVEILYEEAAATTEGGILRIANRLTAALNPGGSRE